MSCLCSAPQCLPDSCLQLLASLSCCNGRVKRTLDLEAQNLCISPSSVFFEKSYFISEMRASDLYSIREDLVLGDFFSSLNHPPSYHTTLQSDIFHLY